MKIRFKIKNKKKLRNKESKLRKRERKRTSISELPFKNKKKTHAKHSCSPLCFGVLFLLL
jgi:hypothetical protein